MTERNSAQAQIDDVSRPAPLDPPPRRLTPEAERALKEAAERRAQREAATEAAKAELGGRAGPDPVRYGDWENGGIASDF
jgi:hypothetical protein